MTILDVVAKLWPIFSGVAVAVFATYAWVWRVHVKTQVNQRALEVHKKDDVAIHQDIKDLVHGLYERYDANNRETSRVHAQVIQEIAKQQVEIQVVRATVQRVEERLNGR